MRYVWGLAILFCIPIAGCGGCQGNRDQEKKDEKEKEKEKKTKEKPKRDFEIGRPRIEPHDGTFVQNAVKPGHWVSVTQRMKANNFDFLGQLHSATTDGRGKPVDLERTPFRMTSTRPAALPKGQSKQFELIYYLPRLPEQRSSKCWVETTLRGRRGDRIVEKISEPTTRMQPYHFFFVVLARSPDAYTYLSRMDSIRPPIDPLNAQGKNIYYHVIKPKLERQAPLPSHSLTWTSIAYLLWDDIDPEILTQDQKLAMLDWLHWGGQIIINGPTSLEGLQGSFLDPYLPARAGDVVKLAQTDFDPINERWSLRQRRDRLDLEVIASKPLDGIELVASDGGTFVDGTGGLVAERRVGRGRIVATSFSLTHRQVINWPSYDTFFNSCLLRRPHRRYKTNELGEPLIEWAEFPRLREDARLVSNVRYFTRDASHLSAAKDDPDPGYHQVPQSGVAGWNDFGATANAARQSLKDAAGIVVPEATFVLRVMAVYLIALVPLNWCVFRVIGRVEWAWIAAPVIAVRVRRYGRQDGPAGHRLRPQSHGLGRARSPGGIPSRASDPVHGTLFFPGDYLRNAIRRPVGPGPAIFRGQEISLAGRTDAFERPIQPAPRGHVKRLQCGLEFDEDGAQRANARPGR